MNRRSVGALLLFLLLTAAPGPVRAFPGPPLAPQDRFCAVARAGAYTVYVLGYARRGDAATVTLAVGDDSRAAPAAVVELAGSPPLPATPAPPPAGYDANLAWYTVDVAAAALRTPLRLHVADAARGGAATLRLLHPACDRTPAAAGAPDLLAPPGRPQAHIVQPDDLNPAWTPEEMRALRAAGLPVPATTTALIDVFAAAPATAPASSGAPAAVASAASGWAPLLQTDFSAGWPWAGRQQACRLVRATTAPGSGWDEVDGALTVTGAAPATGARVVQLACVFDDLAAARNLMAQFALWQDPADAAGSFFVGFSNDGRNFVGRRWYPADAGTPGWTQQRVFLPLAGAQAQAAAGRLAVLWEYRQPVNASTPAGIRLDDLSVERFDPPALGCRSLDPTITVAGAPGAGQVSKGLNLPPYPDTTPTGLAGHVARLRQSGVNWARIELQATVAATGLAGRGGQLGYVDLKHYDTLFHLLCAGDPPIAVLGLLDYHMLPDDAWRSGRAAESYRLGFTGLAAQLTRYFGDRVRAWEVWNEPDHPSTYLAPDDFARLLAATYATLKASDGDAIVVLGGLSGAGPAAANYLRRTLAALPDAAPGYDVLGLHPYPSTEFRAAGQTIRDPSYLRSVAPTVVARFQEVMRAAGHADRPIWVTELGWNRGADSADPATANCRRVAATMVTGEEQARYLPESFDILFKETGWSAAIPGVVKIFWYQYGDVGLATSAAECNGGAPTGASTPGSAPTVVDWWYGLYSGVDAARGIPEPQPNRVECTFRAYPAAAAVDRCLR